MDALDFSSTIERSNIALCTAGKLIINTNCGTGKPIRSDSIGVGIGISNKARVRFLCVRFIPFNTHNAGDAGACTGSHPLILTRSNFMIAQGHSQQCTWKGGVRYTRSTGRCLRCDVLKAKRITESQQNLSGENYGMSKEDLKKFCLSGITKARCTKWTNPSCACGKLVLNGNP